MTGVRDRGVVRLGKFLTGLATFNSYLVATVQPKSGRQRQGGALSSSQSKGCGYPRDEGTVRMWCGSSAVSAG